MDLHVWSDHPRVELFLDQLQARLADGVLDRLESKSNNRGTATRDVLKVLALDLFAAWREDPALSLGVPLSDGGYRPRSRYNAQKISKKAIGLIHGLRDADLLDWANHSHSRTNPRANRTTRIRASAELQQMFTAAGLEDGLLRFNLNREALVLRGTDNEDPGQTRFDRRGDQRELAARDLEYSDDELPPFLATARRDLRAYNRLLNESHIDIGSLDQPFFERPDRDRRTARVAVHQGRHFVRRIFSRGRFDFNGRLYGGWWQLCPRDLRKYIRIDRQPTAEIDFAGMHPRILAAEKGVALNEDPFSLNRLVAPEVNWALQRKLVQAFVQTALNAADPKQAYSAFRYSFSRAFDLSLTRALFDALHREFVETYPGLEDSLFSDQGIRLMGLDGQIASSLVASHVLFEMPILVVQNSFIVPIDNVKFLEDAMTQATQSVLGAPLVFRKDREITALHQLPQRGADGKAQDRSPALDHFAESFGVSAGYEQRWQDWLAQQA